MHASHRTVSAPVARSTAPLLGLALAGLLPGAALAQESRTIDVAMHYSQDQAAPLLACFERYEAANPGVTVAYQQLSYGDYLQTVLTSRLGGQAPDVYNLYSIWAAQLVDNGVLAEPPEAVREFVQDTYAAGTVDAVTIRDTLWGVPTEVSAYALVSNMNLLRKAGHDEPPADFETFRQVAADVTTRGANGKIETAGFAFADSSSGAGLVHPFYTALFSAGIDPYEEDFAGTNFASDEAVAALADFRSLIADGITDRSVDGYDFPAGGIGMIVMANWLEANIRAGFGDDFDDAVRVSPVPFGEGWKTLQYAFFFGVDSSSEVQDEAWDLIRWTSSPESAEVEGGPSCVAGMLEGLGALSANLVDNEALGETDAFTAGFVEALAEERAISQPNVMQAAEIEGLMARTIDEAINGDVEPREALEALDREVSDILFEFY